MTKIISLTNEVYEKLRKMKNNRSFSNEINDLIESAASSKKGSLSEVLKYAGTVSKKDAEALRKEVERGRKNAKPRFFG